MPLLFSYAEMASCDGYEAPFDYARARATQASGGETWVYVHAPLQPIHGQ